MLSTLNNYSEHVCKLFIHLYYRPREGLGTAINSIDLVMLNFITMFTCDQS